MAAIRLFPTGRTVGIARLARWIAVAIVTALVCAGALTLGQASRSLPAAPVAAAAPLASGHDGTTERLARCQAPASRPRCVQADAQPGGDGAFEPTAVFDVDNEHNPHSVIVPAYGVERIDFPIGSEPIARGEPRVYVTRVVSGEIFSRGPPA